MYEQIGVFQDLYEQRLKIDKGEDKIIDLHVMAILKAMINENKEYKYTDFLLKKAGICTFYISQNDMKWIKKNAQDYIIREDEYLSRAWERLEIDLYLKQTDSIDDKINSKGIDGWQYEKLVAKYFDNEGYLDVDIVGKSGDQGIDIVAYKNNIKYGIQCKYYSNPVSNKAVQEAFSGKNFYKCDRAIVITNNIFTQAAQKLALDLGVMLMGNMTPDNMNISSDVKDVKVDHCQYNLINEVSDDGFDPLIEKAILYSKKRGKTSVEFIERVLHIGKNRSETIIKQLELLNAIDKKIDDVTYDIIIDKIILKEGRILLYKEVEEGAISYSDDESKMVVDVEYDKRLYTYQMKGVDDVIVVKSDILYFKSFYINEYETFCVPISFITTIEVAFNVMLIYLDKQKLETNNLKDDISVPDNYSVIPIVYYIAQRNDFANFAKVIAKNSKAVVTYSERKYNHDTGEIVE